MTVMVDAKHYGRALFYGRHQMRLHTAEVAAMLRISVKAYKQYERGTAMIPQDLAERIATYAFMVLCARYAVRVRCNKKT